MTDSNHSPTVSTSPSTQLGAGAAAAPASASLKPLLLRAAIGALAIIGLSGIGAFSMLTGMDGAHASPPEATSIWLAASGAASAGPISSAPAPAPPPVASATSVPVAGGCPTLTDDGKVILNRADVSALRKLPTIGPKRAEAILALRTKLKRFRRPSELLRIKGIGPKSLLRIQPHFVLDDPKGNGCETATTDK